MHVIKRDGREVEFDKSKISSAISKAMQASIGRINEKLAIKISDEIETELSNSDNVNIKQIEQLVYSKLIKYRQQNVAKTYELVVEAGVHRAESIKVAEAAKVIDPRKE